MIKPIQKCRICGGTDLIPVINLGVQTLTGIFPRTENQIITSGPLELVRCNNEKNKDACGLLQLRHSYDLDEMYSFNYGYRSGLNVSMMTHLKEIVDLIQRLCPLEKDDLVLDIGSNDGTLLSFFPEGKGLNLVGIDPTGIKFKKFYQERINLIPTFFSAAEMRKHFGSKKLKVITSISMFYDLEAPMKFMQEIFDVLADNGIWVLEQSYMPSMLEMIAYDTICHEHLEYYGLKQIKWMADRVGLKIIGASLDDTNGGSFLVTLSKKEAIYKEAVGVIERFIKKEDDLKLHTEKPYREFSTNVDRHKKNLLDFFEKAALNKKRIIGYGASTKGNVILQYCGITRKDLPYIAEINTDKFGCYTPGTLIPIISESEARAMKPDCFFVLPWHFRQSIIEREKTYLRTGGKIVFPLPKIDVVTS